MNKDRYKSELNNIKPDERLVRNTINLIKEKQEQKERKSIFAFNKFAVGFCSLVIIGGIGYATYNYNTNTKENNSSKENDKYASSTIYKIEEENSNILSNITEVVNNKNISTVLGNEPAKVIGLDKISESDFTGMYLIRETNNSKWTLYKHTKEYINYKEFISRLDDLASGDKIKFTKSKNYYQNSYLKITDTKGSATLEKGTMLVKVGPQYLFYIPKNINKPVVVQLLSANDIAVYSVTLDSKKQSSLDELRKFISNTGTEIKEDKQESVDRNVKVYVNGKEDKSQEYKGETYKSSNSYTIVREYLDGKFTVELKNNFKEISNPAVKFNTEIEISTFKSNVKKVENMYITGDPYPFIFVLTKKGDVYYIRTSEWVKNGRLPLTKVVTGATDITSGKDKDNKNTAFATIGGKLIALNVISKEEIDAKKDEKKFSEIKTSDVIVRRGEYDSKIYFTFTDKFKNEISEPKITLNKEIEVPELKGNVKELLIEYVGKESYPYIIIQTIGNKVYVVKTSDCVRSGKITLTKVTENATKIFRGKNSEGSTRVYAQVDNKALEIELK